MGLRPLALVSLFTCLMCVKGRTDRQVLLFCLFVLPAVLPRQEAIGASPVILLPPLSFSLN